MRNRVAFLTTLAVLALPAFAQAQDLLPHQINLPAIDQWQLSGDNHRMVKDANVNGGYGYEIVVAKADANPWDVQAAVATTQPIHKGDVVLMAFWARAVKLPEGADSATINANIQQGHAPYMQINQQTVKVGTAWKLYYVSGTAPVDFTAGEASGDVQLATAAQTVALGPVFILDFGPGYDAVKLPRN